MTKHFFVHFGWRIFLALTFLFCSANCQAKDDFSSWLARFHTTARSAGISEETLEKTLAGIHYNDLVIRLDRHQPEFTLSFSSYLQRTVSSERLARGRKLLRDRGGLCENAARYGVPASILVALWGIETDYGRVTGSFPVVEALATLTYDPRRSAFFRRELMAALRLVDSGAIQPERLEGSWAGALGYLQFLPSVLEKYGVDADGDKSVAIWKAGCDLFATAARYLASQGWRPSWRWGREVNLLGPVDQDLIGLTVRKDIEFWDKQGVRKTNGRPLPQYAVLASLIQPDPDREQFFLVYENFRVLMRWNRSIYYALAVGMLSDGIKE